MDSQQRQILGARLSSSLITPLTLPVLLLQPLQRSCTGAFIGHLGALLDEQPRNGTPARYLLHCQFMSLRRLLKEQYVE